MKKYVTVKTMMVMVLVLVIGTAGSALAYRGWAGQGQGGFECPEDGCAWNRGGGPGAMGKGPGGGYGMSHMSREDFEKMNQLRQAFFKDTEALRSDLRSKSLELKSEFAKETPDLQTLQSLQNELSALEARMAQKRIEHQLEMKKVNPDAGKGFRMGAGPGSGRGGNGGCWR